MSIDKFERFVRQSPEVEHLECVPIRPGGSGCTIAFFTQLFVQASLAVWMMLLRMRLLNLISCFGTPTDPGRLKLRRSLLWCNVESNWGCVRKVLSRASEDAVRCSSWDVTARGRTCFMIRCYRLVASPFTVVTCQSTEC